MSALNFSSEPQRIAMLSLLLNAQYMVEHKRLSAMAAFQAAIDRVRSAPLEAKDEPVTVTAYEILPEQHDPIAREAVICATIAESIDLLCKSEACHGKKIVAKLIERAYELEKDAVAVKKMVAM